MSFSRPHECGPRHAGLQILQAPVEMAEVRGAIDVLEMMTPLCLQIVIQAWPDILVCTIHCSMNIPVLQLSASPSVFVPIVLKNQSKNNYYTRYCVTSCDYNSVCSYSYLCKILP